MRDEHDGSAVVVEERFEPGHRLDVEVIGRLVEEQHIGLRDERSREQHTPPPAAGESRDDSVGRKARAGKSPCRR
jgi:hypothetical protein